ncbi:hypothetical protein Tco_0111122 [Tanacetum coccineum]
MYVHYGISNLPNDGFRSGYGDIATLHFIWEGADTFYVTRYDEHGSEIGGYNDLMMQQRRSRILVTIGNDRETQSVETTSTGSGDFNRLWTRVIWSWLGKIKALFDFTNGKRVVLTNMIGNDLRVLVFRDDDLRMRHVCNWKGHSMVHEDEEAVFYQTLCRHVKNEGSLAIPLDFVTANDLFIFEHAKIVYGKKSYRLELHREFYNDDPSRVNDMKLVGNRRRISRSYDLLFTLKIYHNGNFTSPPGRIYHCAEIEWYDLVDSEMFSINGYDAMLEDLGIKDGSILFSHFRILGKSLDEGLVPLMSNQDMLSLLQYVPIYKEIEVYVEKNTMEVVLGMGKGVVFEEVVEDDEVKEASETGNSCKQLLSVSENDVQTKTEPSTPPWSFKSLSNSDINFSHETLEMKNEVKSEQEMEEPMHNDFHPQMYEDDLLQKEDPVNYQ